MMPVHWFLGDRVARVGRTTLCVALGAIVVVTAVTCASGVGRQNDSDGTVWQDSTVQGDAQTVDAGTPEAGVQLDSSVVNDSAVQNDSGPACDPDPMPATDGDRCGTAIDLGVLGDVNADTMVVTGNSMPSGREIWWTFLAADDVDTAGDEFHVDIRFINNPGTAYQMDVYRGDCDATSQLATGETFNFDWYTDFARTSVGCTGPAPCGEGDCVPTPGVEGANSCGDDSAVFFVRVTRVDGQPSCDTFHLEMSNGFYTAP